MKPYNNASKTTIGRWIKAVHKTAGVDINKYKPHSTRQASTSAAVRTVNVPINKVMKAAGWSNESTFRKYYNKPVVNSEKECFSHTIQQVVKTQLMTNTHMFMSVDTVHVIILVDIALKKLLNYYKILQNWFFADRNCCKCNTKAYDL